MCFVEHKLSFPWGSTSGSPQLYIYLIKIKQGHLSLAFHALLPSQWMATFGPFPPKQRSSMACEIQWGTIHGECTVTDAWWKHSSDCECCICLLLPANYHKLSHLQHKLIAYSSCGSGVQAQDNRVPCKDYPSWNSGQGVQSHWSPGLPSKLPSCW